MRAVAARVGTRPAADWIAVLQHEGVPCGLVRSVLEALADIPGTSPLHGVPPMAPASVRRPPPMLDEHGAAVRALGWAACAEGRTG